MGARLKNNSKISNVGYVEDHFCLDIRELLKEKIVVKDSLSHWSGTDAFPFSLIADLEFQHQPFMRVEFSGSSQLIKCSYGTDALNRRKLFFLDDIGRSVEKIYFVDGRFTSRHAGKLNFKTQSKNKITRIYESEPELKNRLNDPTRVLPDEIRQSIQAKLADLSQARKWSGASLTEQLLERQWRKRERRRQLKQRRRDADLAMSRRASVSGNEILQSFTPHIDGLKARTNRISKTNSWTINFTSINEACVDLRDRPHLDTDVLCRLGLVKPGKILARQIGWPIKWLPQRRRRIHLVLDLRNAENSCATIVFQTVKKVRYQLFWLKTRTGSFGRDRYEFECPVTGASSATLQYIEGNFQLVEPAQEPRRISPVKRLWDMRIEDRLLGREGQPLSTERVALLKEAMALQKTIRPISELSHDPVEVAIAECLDEIWKAAAAIKWLE